MWVQATLPTRSHHSLIGQNNSNSNLSINNTNANTSSSSNNNTSDITTNSEDTSYNQQVNVEESLEPSDNLSQSNVDSGNENEKKEIMMEQLRKLIISIEQQAKVVKQEQLILLELIEQRTQLETALARLTSSSSNDENRSSEESLSSYVNSTSASNTTALSSIETLSLSAPKQILRTNTTKTLSTSSPSMTLYEQQRQARKSVDANTAGYLKTNLSLFSQLFATSATQVITPSSLSSSPNVSEKTALTSSADMSPTHSPINVRDANKQSRKNRLPPTKPKKKTKSSDVLISRETSTVSLLTIDSSLSPTSQSSVTAAKKDESFEERRERTRKSVIKEFYTTETDYVRDLSVLYQVYYKEMKKARNELGIQEADLGMLFKEKEILKMIQWNSSLLTRLLVEEEYSNEQSHLGELIKMEIPFMRDAYIEYCSRQSEALDVLRHIRKKSIVASFLEKLRTNPVCHSLDIESFLIKPMQRICRYPLLMKELLKHTPQKHDDYKNIEDSIVLVEEVAKEINETKRIYEDNLNKLLALQSQIIDNDDCKFKIASSRRTIIQSGNIKEVKMGGKLMKRVVWILNDLILIGSKVFSSKSGSKKISIRRVLPLTSSLVAVDDVDAIPEFAKGQKYAIKIVNQTKNVLFAVLAAESKQEKEDWLSKLRLAILEAPSSFDCYELVKYVEIMKNKDPKETQLHVAAANNNIEQMNSLLKCLSEIENINRRDRSGFTPLMIATNKRHWQIALYLLSIPQCSVSISTPSEKNTALHLLLKRTPQDLEELVQYRTVLQAIVDRGADINAANSNGDTPLHVACINNSIEGAHFLVKKQRQINRAQ
eukprot:TRINITY_DN4117_c0_g1_i1.p1 TRINITY_DN4117_c0_g1~~TRINITY_DN4117_c0_g1_i1.p1  ORF type:complete len:830 (+),score=183.45 TRINITY_DN4117_c0_g1_i1:181-2670(+)